MMHHGRAGVRRGGALAVLLLVAVSASGAELVEGEAQVEAGPAAGSGFRFRVERCATALRSEWWSANGELQAWDEVQLAEGRLLRYRLVRPNLGQDITRMAPAGRDAESSEQPVLAGPMLIEFARSVLPGLQSGEVPKVRYLIAETGLLLPLRLRLERRSADSSWVTIEAAQPLLRPLVPRATLEFDARARFVGMRGQILPQTGSERRPEPLAARVRVLASRTTPSCHNPSLLYTSQGFNRGS